jgi:hypothetical protein
VNARTTPEIAPPIASGRARRRDRPATRGALARTPPIAPYDDPPGYGEAGYDDAASAAAAALEADLIALLRADPTITALGATAVSLNVADEKVRSSYITVSGTHTVTRSIGSVKFADAVTFQISCYASTADEAETLGDAVEALLYTTGDDLRMTTRSNRVDFETLLDVSEFTVDGLFDAESSPHVWRAQEWPHVVSEAAAQLQALLTENISAPVILNAADEKTLAPYAVMNATQGPQHTIGGQATADLITFAIACWGTTADETERLADEVENVIYSTSQLRMVSRTTGLDQATGDDVAVVTVDCWLNEGESIGGIVGSTFDVAGFVADGYDESTAIAAYDVAGFVVAGYDEGDTATAAQAYDDIEYGVASYDGGGDVSQQPPSIHTPSTAVADMIAMLAAAPALQGLDVIILNAADEKSIAPYVVVTATIDREHFLSGDVAADHVTFTISCWAHDADEAELIADAIEQVFATDTDDLDVLDRRGGFDQATTMDVAILTADRWV